MWQRYNDSEENNYLSETLLPMLQLCPMVALQTVEFSPIRDPGPTITSSSRTLFLKQIHISTKFQLNSIQEIPIVKLSI